MLFVGVRTAGASFVRREESDAIEGGSEEKKEVRTTRAGSATRLRDFSRAGMKMEVADS